MLRPRTVSALLTLVTLATWHPPAAATTIVTALQSSILLQIDGTYACGNCVSASLPLGAQTQTGGNQGEAKVTMSTKSVSTRGYELLFPLVDARSKAGMGTSAEADGVLIYSFKIVPKDGSEASIFTNLHIEGYLEASGEQLTNEGRSDGDASVKVDYAGGQVQVSTIVPSNGVETSFTRRTGHFDFEYKVPIYTNTEYGITMSASALASGPASGTISAFGIADPALSLDANIASLYDILYSPGLADQPPAAIIMEPPSGIIAATAIALLLAQRLPRGLHRRQTRPGSQTHR